MHKIISGQIIDIPNRRIFPGTIEINNGFIQSILEVEEAPSDYILPGFIDAHIHIESSMLVPYEFAKIALKHGTIATVSDPHEIANVMGMSGVHYMIDNARDAQLKFHFGAPSCVPATQFETAGATVSPQDVEQLLLSPDIYYLSEMMNYPGVLSKDPDMLQKIKSAHTLKKPVDGHAPGLKGDLAKQYIEAGITTDHECYTLEEALSKLSFGMKIIIREGSAAKNFNALHSIIASDPDKVMFCSDDKHPDDLLEGHINQLVVRSLELGYDLYDVLRIACLNPKEHYGLRSGALNEGDPADFIIVSDLESLNVVSTYIDGVCVMENGITNLPPKFHPIINQFNVSPVNSEALKVPTSDVPFPIIQAIDGALITEKLFARLPQTNDETLLDIENDILKIVVVNRYRESPISIGFIQNFGLQKGAIASTVAHDSHNIIAVGTSDEELAAAINLLISSKGGLSAVDGVNAIHLALPIAGLMSDLDCEAIGTEYKKIDQFVKDLGSKLKAPFMTLSFMALLVIPKIKISDLGMFDAEAFDFY